MFEALGSITPGTRTKTECTAQLLPEMCIRASYQRVEGHTAGTVLFLYVGREKREARQIIGKESRVLVTEWPYLFAQQDP